MAAHVKSAPASLQSRSDITKFMQKQAKVAKAELKRERPRNRGRG